MPRTVAVLRNTQWVLEPFEGGPSSLEGFLGGVPAIVDAPGAAFTLFQAADGLDLGLPPTAVLFLRELVKMDILRGQLVAFGRLDERGELSNADTETIRALESLLVPVIPTVTVAQAS